MDLPFAYTIKNHPRAKRISISVHEDGEVLVTKPRWISQRAALEVIHAQQAWIERAIERHAKKQATTGIRGTTEEYKQYKEVARRLVHDRLQHFNQYYGFVYNRVAIGNPKTRWGSCSAKGNINFSYKIALLPPELADYVIVHELCHLQEMNHSKRFWKLVVATIPDGLELRKKLLLF